MTTETRVTPVHPGATVVSEVAGAALAGLVAAALLLALAALTTGSTGALSVAVATATVLVVYGLGSMTLAAVTALAPRLALLVALLTYTLQVALLALAYWKLSGSGLLDTSLDRAWLGLSLIVLTLVWNAGQVVLTARGVRRREALETGLVTGGLGDLPRGER